jgi:hypothetical protein
MSNKFRSCGTIWSAGWHTYIRRSPRAESDFSCLCSWRRMKVLRSCELKRVLMGGQLPLFKRLVCHQRRVRTHSSLQARRRDTGYQHRIELVRSDAVEGRQTMFATAGLASIIIAAEFLLGSIVGLAVAAVIFRSRLRIRLAVIAMSCAGAVFICASGVAVWADLSISFVEGHVIAAAPWSNCPQLANCIADNRLALSIASGAITAAIASLCLRGRAIKARQHSWPRAWRSSGAH